MDGIWHGKRTGRWKRGKGSGDGGPLLDKKGMSGGGEGLEEAN